MPRPEYFNMLDSYLRDGGAPVVVTGDSGIGKSALLANWVKHVRETDPSISVYSHYVGATPDSADWRLMLRRLMTELQRDHGIQGNIPEDARELKKCFANWLHMASVKCRVALVLDAVNRLEDRDGAQMLSWLSSTVPANVRLVISAMQGKALDEAIERRWKIVEVRPLSVAERADLIRAYLGEYRKKLPSDIVGSIPSEEQCGNPLYLKIFLDELRQQGRHETLKDTIRAYLSARSVVDLYSMVLRRYQQDYETGRENLVRDTCCLLLASRKGLSETELRYMLGNNGVQLQNRHWSPLYLALESALINRLGLLSFAHDYITEAVRKTYPSDLREYKQRIVEYFDHGEAADRRKAEELPWQLFSLGEWEKLAERLKEVEIVKTAWEQNQYDVKKYWTAIQDKAGKDVTFYYRDTISGDSVDDEYWLLDLSVLLRDMGFPDEAWKVQVRLAESGKISRDRRKMQVLLGNMALLLQRWGKLDEAMQLHKEEEKISRELNDRDVLQGSLGNQGTILQRQGMLKEAMQLHKEQERICRELNDRNGLQVALCNQALILKKWGRFKEAMQLHKEEEKISRELNNLESLQISLGDQALILKRWGKLDEALQLHLEEERICRELNDRYGLQASLGNHGIILQIQDKLDEALQLHREQERICRELNNRNDLPVALGNQAVILQSQGKLEEAMKLHQEEEAIYRELNNLRGAGISLGNQALILQSQDKLEEAMRLHKEEERICRDLDDLEGLQICLGNEALILKRWGKLVEAMQLHREQERISREQNNYEGIANSLFNQALILATDEKLQESLSLFEEAYNTAQVSGNIAFVREIEPVILKVREIMDARKRS